MKAYETEKLPENIRRIIGEIRLNAIDILVLSKEERTEQKLNKFYYQIDTAVNDLTAISSNYDTRGYSDRIRMVKKNIDDIKSLKPIEDSKLEKFIDEYTPRQLKKSIWLPF